MRIIARFVAVLLVATQHLAAAGPTTLRVVTDHPDAVYRRGDTVNFSITAPAGQKVRYKLSKDGFVDLNWGEVGSSGNVTASLDEPGVIQCETIGQADATTKPMSAMAGAAIEPDKIAPSLPVPEDFDAFWERQKSRLGNEPAQAVLTWVKSPDNAVECFDVQINCPGGAPVSGYLAYPKGAQPRSLAALLHPHSAGVRDSDLPYAVRMAKRGLLAFDFNAHGLPNGKGTKFYEAKASNELRGYPAFGADDREKIYFVGMFLRVLRALDFLTQQPQWDGKTLIALGSSQGGGQVLFAAAMDQRVTLCLASVPALCDHTGFVVNRAPGWPRIVPKDASGKYSEKATQASRYIDVMNFAPRIKCPTYVTVGFIDRTCAATSVYAAFNNIPGTTEKHIIPRPLMGHSFAPDLIARFDKIIEEHVATKRQE